MDVSFSLPLRVVRLLSLHALIRNILEDVTEEKVEANMVAVAPADPVCWLCPYRDHAAPARGCSPKAKVRTETEASAGAGMAKIYSALVRTEKKEVSSCIVRINFRSNLVLGYLCGYHAVRMRLCWG